MIIPLIEPLEARIAPAIFSFAVPQPAGIAEGNDPLTPRNLEFRVTLDTVAATDASVDYTTRDGTATVADNDYDLTFGTLIIPAGETQGVIRVPVRGDTVFEGTETFSVDLSNPSSGHTINNLPTRKTGIGTIKNDDVGPVPTVSISDPLPFDESSADLAPLTFRATLSNESLSTVTVVVTTVADGTATNQADFTAKTQTLTFLPGETSKDFTVSIVKDSIDEPDEFFHVDLSSPSNATLGSVVRATGTILDDDAVPTVSINSLSTLEGDVGTGTLKNADFTVTLTNPSSSTITVTATSAADGGVNAATAGTDFTAVSRTVTFLAGETSKTFSVPIVGDSVPEADETFQVTLSAPVGAALGAATVGTGTILDDERVFIDASSLDVRIAEGDIGSKAMVFTVKLAGARTQAVTVTASTTPGTATAGVDYTTVSQLLTFAPGETSKTVSVPLLGDLNDEENETFFVDLTNPSANASLGAARAVGTILNDEVRISVNDVARVETNAGDTLFTFNVTLSRAANHPVVVNFATQDGSAISTEDYDAQSGTLVFVAGETMKPVSILVQGDTTGELDEKFLLNLSNATGALIDRNTGTGTILNDETTLSISDVQVLEGNVNGVTQAVFTVTLQNGPTTGNVTVNYSTANGTAIGTGTTGGTDYTSLAAAESNKLTFVPGGQTSQQVVVTITGDTSPESNETFSVNLAGESSNVLVARRTGTGTILNDDGALTISDVTVTEGDAGMLNAVFLVNLFRTPNTSPGEVKVDVTTEAGTASTADFSPFTQTRTLTFAANETQKLVTVPIVGDLIKEGTENFVVRLANATGATIAKDAGIGTILDNNDPQPTLSLGNGRLVEGNSGTSEMQFIATLSQPASETVTATYSTRDLMAARPALAGLDYTQVTDQKVTFAPGQTSVSISVPILGDTLNESDETFGVRLSAPIGATLGTVDAVGTIQNDEVTVGIEGISLAESSGGTTTYFFQVVVSAPGSVLTDTVTVNFETKDGTAISTGALKDFTAALGTLTFTPGGGLSQQVGITVVGDNRLENDEQFFVNLISSVNATIGVAQGVGTIQNDDVVQISIADKTFTEGESASGDMKFVVSLDRPSDLPVTVKVNTVDGTATKSVGAILNDFTGITDQTITFNPGETSKEVTVKVINDTVDEEKSQTFTLALSGETPAGVTIPNRIATGTIIDNDLRTLSVADVSIVEGNAGTSEVTFTVSRSAASSQALNFTYATADITATAGQDYVPASNTGSIPANQTSTQIKVLVNGDTASEVNERFLFKLLSSTNANISTTDGQATATIVDDEAGGARLELVPVSGVEFDEVDRVVEFNVVRTGNLARAVTVQFETVDDTAQSFGEGVMDFVEKSGTISFAAGSSTASERIRVRILGDINFENEEFFQVRLFNPVNAAILDGGDVVTESLTDVTIFEDMSDLAPTLSVADVRIVEGNAGTQQLVFKVRLSASNEKIPVTVMAATAVGTDTATNANPQGGLSNQVQDYSPGSATTLTFDQGDLEKDFVVTVNGDTRDESDEEFLRVLLSGASGAVVTRAEAKGTIVDNDAAPTLTVTNRNPTLGEGSVGQTSMTFDVRLSEISERPVSVRVTTQPGTAISTGLSPDFQAVDSVFSYEPGSPATGFTFSVLINGDTLNEADETFGVTVSNAVNGQLRQGALNVTSTSLTATIDDDDALPVILVNDANLIEGDSGAQEMIFTVSLSAASGQTVDVKFATMDGTTNGAFSVGPMADFISKTGALKFAPGETEKEVRVVIKGDTFREQSETFSLQLSGAVNATIITATGTGTILADGDSTVGIGIRNAFKVEGDSGTSNITFVVELSDSLPFDTTFGAVSTSGSAVRGADFAGLGNTVYRIAAGEKTLSTSLPEAQQLIVKVNGDTAFEATESFFVELRNVENAGETLTIAGGTARGTIFNDDIRRVDNRTVQFVDVDGDLATVHISKGILATNRLAFGPTNAIGGRQLQVINLTGDNLQFQDADVSVTAIAQPGFNGDANGVKGNGFVNVGAIRAATASGILQFANGIDLGTVNIDGDLGKIHVGDTAATSAINSLVVRSMGRFGTTTQGSGNTLDTVSRVLGPIDSFRVYGNFQSTLQIVGAQFGIIRNLQIDGALLGGTEANSGAIFFSGRIDNAQIGKIVGGAGDVSGSLRSLVDSNSRISNIRVIGDVLGGTGDNSGSIVAPVISSARIGSVIGGEGAVSGQIFGDTIDRLVVTRNVIGGAGSNSAQIFGNDVLGTVRILGEVRGGSGENSGFIGSNGRVASVFAFGSIFGGSGEGSGSIASGGAIAAIQTGALVGGTGDNSGTIRSGGHVQSLSIFGNVEGGTGDRSGGVEVGGKLFSGFVSGNIVGGDSSATDSLSGSGFVFAHRMQRLTVGGDLVSGTDGGGGLALSGTIRSETTIGTVRIRGSVLGSEGVAAIIGAPGDTTGAAIQTLIIDGDVRFAEILGGYDFVSTAANPRGTPVNSDARIGTVAIGGDLQSTSFIAGAVAGTDGVFGTIDDFAISGVGTTNAAGTVSKIARIILGGNVLASTRSAGIEAQFVESVTVGGSAFALTRGPGNDGAPGVELTAGSGIRVFEVPVV